MATAKKTERKKSAVLKKAVKPSTKEAITDIKQNLTYLKAHLKGYRMDLKETKMAARTAATAAVVAHRIVVKQLKTIDLAKDKIEKLKAA